MIGAYIPLNMVICAYLHLSISIPYPHCLQLPTVIRASVISSCQLTPMILTSFCICSHRTLAFQCLNQHALVCSHSPQYHFLLPALWSHTSIPSHCHHAGPQCLRIRRSVVPASSDLLHTTVTSVPVAHPANHGDRGDPVSCIQHMSGNYFSQTQCCCGNMIHHMPGIYFSS
jgi:hypothetical protein